MQKVRTIWKAFQCDSLKMPEEVAASIVVGIFVVQLFGLPGTAIAQFVPNPSFELRAPAGACADCPSWPQRISSYDNQGIINDQIRFLDSWYIPNYASSDWYHAQASNNFVGTPWNFTGRQHPVDNTEGYAGIYILQDPYKTNDPQWREYVQAELLIPLLPFRSYEVSFKVSLAELHGSGLFLQSIKKLGAYFSAAPLLSSDPFDVTALPATPQIVSDFQLDVTDRPADREWMTVSGMFTPQTQTLRYITIGNFQDVIPTEDIAPVVGMPEQVQAYYFIDDVRIQDLGQTCHCGYGIATERIKDEAGKCCYNITVSARENTCPLYKIEMFTSQGIILHTFDPPLTGSDSQTFKLCLDVFEGGTEVITAYFYTADDNFIWCGEDGRKIVLACKCACDDLSGDNFDIILENATDNGEECCWNVVLQNSLECDKTIYGVSIESNFGASSVASYGDSPVTPWVTTATTSANRTMFRNYSPSLRGTLLPRRTRTTIGTLCLPENASAETFTIRIHTDPKDESVYCEDEINIARGCGEDIGDCCNNLFAMFQYPIAQQGSDYHLCFPSLVIMQNPTPGCAVHGLRVLDLNTPAPHATIFEIPADPTLPLLTNNPIDPYYVPSTFFNLCDIPGNAIALRVEFLNSSGNPMCLPQDLIADCDCSEGNGGGPGGSGRSATPQPQDPVDSGTGPTKLKAVTVAPNPAQNRITVTYELNTAALVIAEMYASDGRIVQTIPAVSATLGENTLMIDASQLPSGVYRLKLKAGDAEVVRSVSIVR